MAKEKGRELFRKKSLQRLSSPERLDHLLEVVDRKTWVPLVAVGVLVVAILLWAVLGTIPINVEGRGILIRPRQIVEFQSSGPGRVKRLEVGVGSTVRRGQLLASIERPDLEEKLRLHKIKAADLMAQSRVGGDATESDDADGSVATRVGPSLRDHIERTRHLAEGLRSERLQVLDEEGRRIDKQETVARRLSESLGQRVESQQRV